jgi:hypothetical protein
VAGVSISKFLNTLTVSSFPQGYLFFFFLEKKEAKIQGCETMAKNYSFRSSRAKLAR